MDKSDKLNQIIIKNSYVFTSSDFDHIKYITRLNIDNISLDGIYYYIKDETNKPLLLLLLLLF